MTTGGCVLHVPRLSGVEPTTQAVKSTNFPTWRLPLLKLSSDFVQGVLEILKYFYRLNSCQNSHGILMEFICDVKQGQRQNSQSQ